MVSITDTTRIRSKPAKALLAMLAVALGWGWGMGNIATAAIVTNLTDIVTLKETDQATSKEIRAETTVLYHDRDWGFAWLSGSWPSFFKLGPSAITMQAGDRGVLSGRTVPGTTGLDWATVRFDRTSQNQLPEPQIRLHADSRDLQSSLGKWVELTAEVAKAELMDHHVVLYVTAGNHRGEVVINSHEPSFIVPGEAEITATGVLAWPDQFSNAGSQFKLFVPSPRELHVRRVGLNHRFNGPLFDEQTLRTATNGTPVRFYGKGLEQDAATNLFTMVGASRVRFDHGIWTGRFRPDWIEAVGLVEHRADQPPLVRNAIYRHVSPTQPTQPTQPSPPTRATTQSVPTVFRPVLGSVRSIRRLSVSEAAQAQPVDLVATVTADFTRFGQQVLFIDDGGEGIYVYPNWETSEFRVGDLVRVTGLTSDGNFAPEIVASEIQPLGNGPVPHPRPMTFSQLLPGNEDSQWVEVTGYVRDTGMEDRIAYLSLTDGNSTLRVWLAHSAEPKELQGAVVRVTGNAGTRFNSRRQVVGIQLWCPSPRLITPEEPPRADPFTAPEEELSELRRFRPGSTRLRWTRVAGVVTAVISPRQVIIQEDGTAALVTFAQDAKLDPGYAVEVAGLVYWDGERTELGESVFRTKGIQQLPPPLSLPLTIGEEPKQDLEGVRVRFEGELVNVHREPNHLRISLIAEEPVDVICPPPQEANALRELTKGSRLAVEGSMLFDRRDAVGRRSPRCYLASASHVEVLYRAPWWTLRHTLTTVGWTGVLGLAALAWVRSLRHQVADKTREVQARLQREAQLEHINAELVFAASEIIFSHDQAGCIRSFNPAAELITGYKAAEIIGRPLLDFVAPEDAARAKALIAQVISNVNLERQEIRCMRADGSRIWMEISIHPLPSQQDGLRFGGIARDITDRKRAEASLRTNEKNLRNILESLADAVLLINSKGSITFANTQVRQIFGLEPASLINAPADRLLTSGPIDRLISALSETEADGRPASTLSSMTVQASRCDGTPFPADLSLALVSHASRRAGMICVRDATRRITAEATLREQALIAGLEAAIAKILSAPTTEARMFNLCAHAVAERLHATAIGVWMLDEDGTTLELHAAAGTLPLGNSPFGNVPSTDPFLGRVVRDGEPVNIQALPSDTPTSMRAWCAEHKIDCFCAQPIIVGNQPVGALAAFATGDTSGEHRRGLASVAVAISTSIDRLRSQESVARTNETLRAILDSAPVAIVEVAIDGRVRGLWNRAAVSLFGWPLEEVIGENLGPIIGMPGDQASMLQNRLLKGETITGWEVTRTRKDGSIVECSVYAAPLYGPNRRVHGSVQVILDLTERRRLEQESERIQQKLREAQRLESLGVLAGGIAHDFNNILGTILGNADLADFDVRPGSSMAEALAEIRGGARRAAELCRLMLAYAGKASMHTAPADLTAVVRDTVQLVRHSISKKARIILDLAEDMPQFEGDTAQVQQVVMNLITNASDALPDQTGTIRITTGVMHASRSYLLTTYLAPDLPEGRYVFAEVEDTGCGMTPEVVQRIFDPFFTTKFTGRGLGLAAVWGIIGRHKGALHVASQPEKGTTFRILLPALASNRARPGSTTPLPRPSALAKSGLVVVIDDEPSLRIYVTRHFARSGILTATAEDGIAGEALVRERLNEISLVVLDLTMPRADGAETLARIRAFAPELPVVIMSGYSPQNVRERLQNHRFISFLGKPFTGAELDEAAANAIGQVRSFPSQPNPSDPPTHGSPA